MKEIVIKLSDTTYKNTLTHGGNSNLLVDAVRNGKVLPKGHTELIDTRILIQDFCVASSAMKDNGVAPVFDLHEITNLILAQEIIIEADKEEEHDT